MIKNLKLKIKNLPVLVIGICLEIVFCNLLFPPPARSQHFESATYTIDWGNFNMTSGKKSSNNYSLTDTVGQNAPGQFDSNGYTAKMGFQYIYDILINKFSFEIDNLDLNFGSLTPNVGTTLTNTLTITTPSGHGYDVTVSQNHPLTNSIGQTIPDTTCNLANCSETTSALWDDDSKYGFGIGASGPGATTYFATTSHYRQFANQATSEIPQIIASENSPVKDHINQITYKVNISPLQPEGQYQNSINFTAIPKY
ncbi:MAG: hypothetical protein WCV93_01325 [Candidatus Shapirobacteria bacterium]